MEITSKTYSIIGFHFIEHLPGDVMLDEHFQQEFEQKWCVLPDGKTLYDCIAHLDARHEMRKGNDLKWIIFTHPVISFMPQLVEDSTWRFTMTQEVEGWGENYWNNIQPIAPIWEIAKRQQPVTLENRNTYEIATLWELSEITDDADSDFWDSRTALIGTINIQALGTLPTSIVTPVSAEPIAL